VSAVLIIVGALVGTGAVLALAVWLVGRAEDRHEASERDAMRQADPPILGGGPRPRHMRRPPT
jgi:hypothetical protein